MPTLRRLLSVRVMVDMAAVRLRQGAGGIGAEVWVRRMEALEVVGLAMEALARDG